MSDFAYVARRPCGCASGVVVDSGDKFTAKAVADFIKSGRPVERMTVEAARQVKYTSKCEHGAQNGR